MDDGCGALVGGIVVLMIAVSVVWWGISAVLIGVLYIFCGAYLALQFVAVNFFAVAEAMFYFDSGMPPLPSWILGGALCGVVGQGVWEVVLRDERTMAAMLLLPLFLLLLWIVVL